MCAMGKVVLMTKVVFIVVAIYFALRLVVSFSMGFSWADMDWNEDGHTSISEVLYSSDVVERGIQVEGVICREFLRMKDATTLKIYCDLGS